MMKVTPSIVRYEFIGLETKIVKSSNLHTVGITGRVVDESRNTLTILQEEKRKVIIKDTAIIDFIMPDGTILEVDGKVIVGRPEDRIKKRLGRLW